MHTPCLKFWQMEMENGENKTAIDVIVISDDEDSQDKHPLDLYQAGENNLKNPVIVIEEDDNVNEERETPSVGVADANKSDKKSQVSSSVKCVYSPLDRYKVSKHGIKELKVRLTKLDFGNKPLNHRTKLFKTEENGACIDNGSAACSTTEGRDLKLQVSNLI